MRPLRALQLSLAGLFLANTAMSADDCQPESWKAAALHAGRINCRDGVTTESKVDSNTCALLASKNRLSMKAFFDLNPRLGGDCQSILPDTMYCVNGCEFHYYWYGDAQRTSTKNSLKFRSQFAHTTVCVALIMETRRA